MGRCNASACSDANSKGATNQQMSPSPSLSPVPGTSTSFTQLASQVKLALGYLSSADSRSPPLETSLARSLLVIDYVEANKRVIGELFRRVSKQLLCSNK